MTAATHSMTIRRSSASGGSLIFCNPSNGGWILLHVFLQKHLRRFDSHLARGALSFTQIFTITLARQV
jgi:hypothetical protein